MEGGDLVAQRQSQAEAPLLSGAGLVRPVEGLRQVAQRLGRMPRPLSST